MASAQRNFFSKFSMATAALFLAPSLRPAEQQTIATIEPLYRAYRFSTQPSLNPETTFVLKEFPIAGLWDALRVLVFAAEDLVRGNRIPRDPVICSHGKIFPFVNSFGGSGLMSAVVMDDALYYSYSWGSGIHRSLVGRLRVVAGKIHLQESEPRWSADLLVEKTSAGAIKVFVASFRKFNRWVEPSPVGRIDLQERERLKIVDDAGRVIRLTGPR
jgi:hypothetical protein